jgi:seryl-tRNA(Sec) selenium transferase
MSIVDDPQFADFQADAFERWKQEQAQKAAEEAALADATTKAEQIAQSARVEPIPEWSGWRFHLPECNATIDGFGDMTEDQARAAAVEPIARMLVEGAARQA